MSTYTRVVFKIKDLRLCCTIIFFFFYIFGHYKLILSPFLFSILRDCYLYLMIINWYIYCCFFPIVAKCYLALFGKITACSSKPTWMRLKMKARWLSFWRMPESNKGRVSLMSYLPVVVLIRYHLLFLFVTTTGSYPPSVSNSLKASKLLINEPVLEIQEFSERYFGHAICSVSVKFVH